MTIQTIPVFYYVNPVTGDNNLLDFREPNQPPALPLIGSLDVGSRSVTNLLVETQRALNDAGQEDYTVTIDRNTRLVTISATDEFELLVATGANTGNGVLGLLGFTGSDRTGASSYVADTPIGAEYSPQFLPQRFRSFDDNLEGIQTSVNQSASGVVEVVTFGDIRLMEMEITNATNRLRSYGNPIQNNQNAIQELRDFMTFCIRKSELEFMISRADRQTYVTVLLERTRTSRQGTGFRLNELLNNDLEGFYSTDIITFRKVT